MDLTSALRRAGAVHGGHEKRVEQRDEFLGPNDPLA
jgi:hypothetical protein